MFIDNANEDEFFLFQTLPCLILQQQFQQMALLNMVKVTIHS